jgi:hypothetical protein
MNKITIRLGITKPTKRQYESIRADITCEYDLTAMEANNLASKNNSAYQLIKSRTEKLLTEAVATAEETLHPIHKVESGQVELKKHE